MKRFLALALLLVAAPVRAQDADPLKHLAPYLGEDAALVGRLDVKNVDVEQMVGRFAKFGGEPALVANELKANLGAINKVKEQLLAAGARHVCFTNVGKLLDFQILGVIPSNDPQAVVQALDIKGPLATRIAGKVVLVGTPKALAAADKVVAKANPEWAKIVAKLESHPSYAAIMPPRALARVFLELQPDLPKELGGGPMQPLVDGIRWVSVGVDLSEKLNVELAIQTADEPAAKRIEPVMERGLTLLESSPLVKQLPTLGKLLENHRPKLVGDRFVMALDSAAVDSVIIPAAGQARQAASVAQSVNNLKQIGVAMHNYHDGNRSFPPQATVDKAKKPLLSWRVQILPYIEQGDLYKEFRQDEPWDSEHNKKLIAKMPAIYRSPLSKTKPQDGITTYVVPSGPKAFFDGAAKKKIAEIPDGTSNTIMVLDVADDKGVVWTRPDDYPVDPKKANVGHFRPAVGRILAAFFDGSVRQLSSQLSDETLWFYFCPNDGNAIPPEN